MLSRFAVLLIYSSNVCILQCTSHFNRNQITKIKHRFLLPYSKYYIIFVLYRCELFIFISFPSACTLHGISGTSQVLKNQRSFLNYEKSYVSSFTLLNLKITIFLTIKVILKHIFIVEFLEIIKEYKDTTCKNNLSYLSKYHKIFNRSGGNVLYH